jgi:hypothetical protein
MPPDIRAAVSSSSGRTIAKADGDIGDAQEARPMRLTSDPRPAGYPVAIILLLVAPYCALVGSEWIAAGFALAGTTVLAVLARTRRGHTRLARRRNGPMHLA